jgi:Na+/H+ antiporter NhaD/arsenite permease-like protein
MGNDGLTDPLATHWVGFAALAIFVAAYALVIAEETVHLRKSLPMVIAGGLLWVIIATAASFYGLPLRAETAFRRVFLEYAELLLFLLVAMTYINALEERRVFDVLRALLVRAGLSYRALFWAVGGLAFAISPVADNLTTALVMSGIVIALGKESPRFIVLACINIVVAANAGGTFSPFGDITTLMVWQRGLLDSPDLIRLFVPSLANFLLPALLMHFAVPRRKPTPRVEAVRLKVGARRIAALFAATIATAIAVHAYLELPAVLGMVTGLGYLQLLDYHLQLRARRHGQIDYAFNVFQRIAEVEWDTLLFFYGVMMCVGALALLGYLALTSSVLYGGLGATAANTLVGIASAVLDNIPLMYAVITMHPHMPLGQWLLITLTTGVGGSLLSIGSAAGIALMGQARGTYTFAAHLRWTPAVASGYAASIAVHVWLNRGTF